MMMIQINFNYTRYGAGWRGSEEKYEGADENKFKETVVKILENHVHLKKKQKMLKNKN